jgi:hypothetical protein
MMAKELSAVLAYTEHDRVIVMKIGEDRDMLWNWYMKVRDLVNRRNEAQDKITKWHEHNHDRRNGQLVQLDTPKSLATEYKRVCQELQNEGITNYKINDVDIVKVGEGMEMDHIE